MLSNPTNNLHNRQRQHRRQNSTPNAFEPVKASNLPNIQRQAAHRRGMSLDQRRRQTPPQAHRVSNTNQGYQTTQSQHILQETQQQRLVRPGHQFAQFDNDENYLSSPAVTPNRQSFDAGCRNQNTQRMSQSQFQFPGPINTIIQVDPNNFAGNNDFHLYQSETVLTPSAYLDFSTGFENNSQGQNSTSHSRRSSAGRRISGGILDRVSQFEQMALQSPCRPITPPNQNASQYFPLTPVDTPHDRMIKQEHMNQRFLDSYDTSMEETIKPRSSQRARGVFDDMRQEAERSYMPSPPSAGRAAQPNHFDSAPMPSANFMNMSNNNMAYMKNAESDVALYSPVSNNFSPSVSYQSSHNVSPEVSQNAMFGDAYSNKPDLEAPGIYSAPMSHGLPMSSSVSQQSHQSHQSHQSSHRRSESVSSTNLDESITDTGVSIDEIAAYIEGPDPVDGKWICLFPECQKRFGRKENIKSHVQTHLGDRQFQCPHCKKCFVRQHDLKRHAKIHSGVKPYPCECGNSFARHDALTRHRQRGMCIGAFEGVVKKVVKRGRPRKNRPDNEERLEKSSRTRSKNKAMSSTSSTSGSDSNRGNSPQSDLDILDDKPFGDYEYTQPSQYTLESPVLQQASFEYSQPHSPASANCVSPQAMSIHSPSAYSQHSHRGSVSESIHHPSAPSSPAKSHHSYHSPPGLCDSSSPAASIYYDMESGSPHGDNLDMNLVGGLANISEHDDEMFLEAFAAASAGDMTTTLQREGDCLMGKFESFDDADLFRSSEDVFFGSP